ncbi:MAG: serine/threonine protein kinase, partial [Myxococcales bacterium]|nr:serine/threonine protein kinase [Myxococcales bacterium]
MIGVRLGPFELLEPLGAGAFAEVWRAAHPSGEHVAVKVAREGSAVSWEEAVRLAQLDHPGVVHVYDHGTWEGRGWIAMELARGTLRALESPLPLADLAAHLLRAVAHLHARGIVHRDIKPSNILVGCAPRSGLDPADRAGVRLADLGISWSGAGRGGSSGTPGWAPPEQLRGMTHPSGDVYGVALVVRALATPADQARLAGWLARATAASPGERFPSAAHALAAFPDAGTTVLVGLPRDDAAGTEVAPELGIAETATRPVLLALDVPSAPMEPPAPVVEPAWPSAPPVPPYRRARVGLLDVGLALLPWRPVLPIGRLDLLLALWEALGHGSLALSGDEDDVDEVIGLLRTWVAETGLERDIRHDPEGVRVPPLDGWHLAARLEALGFEASTARVLASGCRTPRELRARVLSFVRADLVQVRPDGLHIDLARVLPAPSDDPADVERALDEAFWRGDLFALASGIPTLQRLVGDDPRLPLVVALARARAEKRRDLATADQLASDAEAAGALGDGRLRAGLYLEAAGTAVRARDPARVREIVALAGQVGDERLAAGLLLTLGFAGYMDGGEDAEPTVRRAAEMAEGRFRSMALSTLCDLRLKAGRPQDALDFALEALACHPPDRPDEELAIRGSVVLAYQTL